LIRKEGRREGKLLTFQGSAKDDCAEVGSHPRTGFRLTRGTFKEDMAEVYQSEKAHAIPEDKREHHAHESFVGWRRKKKPLSCGPGGRFGDYRKKRKKKSERGMVTWTSVSCIPRRGEFCFPVERGM